MAKVKLIRGVMFNRKPHYAGEELEVSDLEAVQFVASGKAEALKDNASASPKAEAEEEKAKPAKAEKPKTKTKKKKG
jgi:hypothetical protein